MRRGGCVVCNASRTIVPQARARYRNVAVVLIEARNEGRLVCVSQGTVTIRLPKKA